MRSMIFVATASLLLIACKEEEKEGGDVIILSEKEKVKEHSIDHKVDTVVVKEEVIKERLVVVPREDPDSKDTEPTQQSYDPNTVDEQLAKNIGNFLRQDHLKKDMAVLSDSDRKFQLYKIDLNNDGKKETFVRFMSSYFCGSGGCKFLLLDHEGEIITDFSVTRGPIWVEPTTKNGWRILLTNNNGALRELVYKGGTYPSNPSVAKKATYDAASGSAVVMFDDEFSRAKTYRF